MIRRMRVLKVTLTAPRSKTKLIKTALEERDNVVGKIKIAAASGSFENSTISAQFHFSKAEDSEILKWLLDKECIFIWLGIDSSTAEGVAISDVSSFKAEDDFRSKSEGVLDKTVRLWLQDLPPDLLSSIGIEEDSLRLGWPNRHVIYQPMLLLSKGVFETAEWQELFRAAGEAHVKRLFHVMAVAMKVSHLAVNAPIPPGLNVLRSPTYLRPLYGDFGPPVVKGDPTVADFHAAFWVSTVQNGVKQVWAPRYTMFSRGNVKEKARILNLPPLLKDMTSSKTNGRGSTAIDFYAGIGYFAFSYVKAGVEKVLCFDINPWSIEGLRRGADVNHWRTTTFTEDGLKEGSTEKIEEAISDPSIRLLAFQMTNERATEIIKRVKVELPPVRHANCGLLPTSRGSWEAAVNVVDAITGGWIHLHENIAVLDLQTRTEEILSDIQSISEQRQSSMQGVTGAGSATAVLDHVEKVKEYAPGIVHCVLDICIPPLHARVRS